ncbi:MAG: hypothetical protein QXQ64_02970 [Candidatus Bathyarchaeia archaeon]
MSKVIRARISDGLYDSLERLARATKKSLSRLVAELLQTALKEESKDTALLSKLVQKIESLQAPDLDSYLQQQLQFERSKRLFLLLFELIREHAALIFVMPEKQQKFKQIAEEIERRIYEV